MENVVYVHLYQYLDLKSIHIDGYRLAVIHVFS